MAAKEAILELLKNCSFPNEVLTDKILECVRQHKLGIVPVARYAKEALNLESLDSETFGTTVESHVRAMVDMARRTDDTVCLPTTIFQELVDKIDDLYITVKKQSEQLVDLEVRLKNEMKLRESFLVERIEAAGCTCTLRDRPRNEDKSLTGTNVSNRKERKQAKQSRSSSGSQKSRRKSTMDDTGEWSSESEGLLDEEHKREQAEDIKKATRSEHRSYSRVVQVQLPRPREDQHVGKSKSEERKSDDRPAWARRTTPPAWESDDDSWAFVTKKKPTVKKAVLYVGNLGTETTEEGVKEFVSRRAEKLGEKAPKIFNVKIFEPKSETRSARLTVAEGDAALLRSPNFWPRPIYARLWNFDFVSKPSLCKEDSGSEKEGHEPVNTENDNTASGPSTSSQWRRPVVLPRNL